MYNIQNDLLNVLTVKSALIFTYVFYVYLF